MRAIMVSVDYADLLSITLPYNRHHFDRVMVVTCPRDKETIKVCHRYNVEVFTTDSFYADGASFNKWRALEEGLDAYGREGWLCIMDADVLWPKVLAFDKCFEACPAPWSDMGLLYGPRTALHQGFLYSPVRHMFSDWPQLPIPPQENWKELPIHRNLAEFAGYSQIFHAGDPVLGPAPWHEVNWKHAGGADSFFQAKWPTERKVRPPFEVLHLGPAGQNWYGRAAPLVDGSVPKEAEERIAAVNSIWVNRRENQLYGRDRFEGEKI